MNHTESMYKNRKSSPDNGQSILISLRPLKRGAMTSTVDTRQLHIEETAASLANSAVTSAASFDDVAVWTNFADERMPKDIDSGKQLPLNDTVERLG